MHGIDGIRVMRGSLKDMGLSLENDDADLIRREVEQRAVGGDSRAQYALAELYLRGVFGYMDIRAARHWCEQAARMNYAPAIFMLAGMLVEDRTGQDTSIDMSVGLLRRAFDLKYGPAACQLGVEYMVGGILQKNADLARNYFIKGVEWGDASSMFRLASLLLDNGDESDLRWAVELLERAAKSNQLEAIFCLTSIYRDGRYGLEKDPEKAAFYDAKYEAVTRSFSYSIDTSLFLRPRPNE